MEASLLKEYDEWLAEHLEELVAKYPAKVVAIQKGGAYLSATWKRTSIERFKKQV